MLRVFALFAALAAVVAGLATVSPANADPADLDGSDRTFARLLDKSGLLFDFKLEKFQGQRYCEDVIEGTLPVDATERLMDLGGYSWDVANSIGSAASVAYCLCANGPPQVLAPAALCRPFELDYARQHGIVIPTKP